MYSPQKKLQILQNFLMFESIRSFSLRELFVENGKRIYSAEGQLENE
jgi:hypothetical protein